MLREKNNETDNDASINTKLNYKIPEVFNIYKKINSYIAKNIIYVYRQDETDLWYLFEISIYIN